MEGRGMCEKKGRPVGDGKGNGKILKVKKGMEEEKEDRKKVKTTGRGMKEQDDDGKMMKRKENAKTIMVKR